MAYTKTNWVNGETPINATNLNKIENGIETVENEIPTVNNSNSESTTDTYSCDYINNNKQDIINDTGWVNISFDSSKFENFSWEPVAYRKIGKIVYVHGGGTIKTNFSLNGIIANGLPLPRQNTALIVQKNAEAGTINLLVSNDGELKSMQSISSGQQILVNFSYIAKD